MHDDTIALNKLFHEASQNNESVAFLDAGLYKVTDTVYVPPGARIVGEGLAAVILATGDKFSNMSSPYPVVQVGKPGETGYIEMSDVVVSTQGATAGAIMIEYNLNTPADPNTSNPDKPPSGLWDVHVRVGGFSGSQLQVAQCPATPDKVVSEVDPGCIAAHTSMHVTTSAGNVYIENSWLWVADHDMDDVKYNNNTQISVFAARGMLIQGTRVWLVGTSVEHHTLYQYQLLNATDVWMGQIQTESPYYQPNPPAPGPFTDRNVDLRDPDFASDCVAKTVDKAGVVTEAALMLPGNPPCAMAWGLRILESKGVVIFGAGLYSFFNNYSTQCSTKKSGENCQARIFYAESVMRNGTEQAGSLNLEVYNLNTIGSVSMATRLSHDVAFWHENNATYASSVAVFHM